MQNEECRMQNPRKLEPPINADSGAEPIEFMPREYAADAKSREGQCGRTGLVGWPSGLLPAV